ncbi:ROK family protein [Haploplasma axanthum]|uniref:ROK family sugar kinase n=1 Tax=Haploplasma axanthum TaxID=29552 RepID=A0A449BBI4_HAPAX|nr:ROK family protein [Haploplasma axanthum]VEU79795.1 ROK family sugar kinase [Haploplasma axanthum]
MKKILTCDIGGTDLKYGIIGIDGTFLFNSSEPTKAKEGGKAIISQIVNFYLSLKEQYDISGIAISSAGIIDPNTTIVLDATNAITDYIGINIRDEINKFVNIPVSVENDVNCMALCESSFGSGINAKSMIAITIGTGIGGAIVLDGHLFHGNGFSAGEWGNMRINNAIYEQIASTKALVLSAQKVYPNIRNGVEVFKLYDSNDPLIIPVVESFFDNLSTGIANIIYSFNPEKLIIGGGITARGEKFLTELISYIKPKVSNYVFNKTEILLAHHKNNAGMIGALTNFLQQNNF